MGLMILEHKYSLCVNDREMRLFDRLEAFQECGFIHSFRHAFAQRRPGEERSEEARKIDWVIEVSPNRYLELQQKSSETHARRHARECPHIPCIWVTKDATDKSIDIKLLTVLERWLQNAIGIIA